MKNFDPNNKISSDDGIFGLPFAEKDCSIVYLPIPWDVTTSYLAGTSKGPDAIKAASEQIDFFDLDFKDIYKAGLFMRPVEKRHLLNNKKMRKLAETILKADEAKIKKNKELQKNLKAVNAASSEINEWVYEECLDLISQGKIPVVVGGDHSTPYGAIKAYAETYKNFGILHLDAHSDTRKAYCGFEYSHASIMFNVMEKIPGVQKLVQVGIRDFCEDEFNYTKKNPKISVYYDQDIHQKLASGEEWVTLAKRIVSELPHEVYLSFDIDGLDPKYCPSTGTPVPGGLEYHQVLILIKEILASGKVLVGFDLVEVAPGETEWDANVAMRLLYKISGVCLASQKKISVQKR